MSIKLLRTKRQLIVLSQKQLISRLLVVMQTLSRLHTEFQNRMHTIAKKVLGDQSKMYQPVICMMEPVHKLANHVLYFAPWPCRMHTVLQSCSMNHAGIQPA